MIKASLTNLTLGIFDIGILTGEKKPSQAIRESLALARAGEAMGYRRYWLGEHHEQHYAWVKPGFMIPLLAAHTQRLRLGTAATLLCLYNPLQIAEEIHTLEAMFPGRIDYGVCSAAPSDDELRAALWGATTSMREVSQSFGEKVALLLAYLRRDFVPGHRFEHGPTPLLDRVGPLWMMGTGAGSAQLAAEFGTGFSYSLFHKHSREDPAIAVIYTDRFGVGARDKISAGAEPEVPSLNLAVSLICAETEREALQQKNWVENTQSEFRVNVWGEPAQCKAQLEALAERYKTSDLLLFMMYPDLEQRLRGYGLLSEIMALHTSV